MAFHPELETHMTDYLLILVSTVLVNNFVLSYFLGLCSFMGVSRRVEASIGMGMATTFVLTLSSIISYLVNTYLLVPFGLGYLRTISFILVIASLVGFTEVLMRKTNPVLYNVLGVYLPLITGNCIVLGVALLNVQQAHNFIQSGLYGLGSALGYTLVMILFAGIRERINVGDVPRVFQGSAIGLVTAGLMALAFMGFSGLVKH